MQFRLELIVAHNAFRITLPAPRRRRCSLWRAYRSQGRGLAARPCRPRGMMMMISGPTPLGCASCTEITAVCPAMPLLQPLPLLAPLHLLPLLLAVMLHLLLLPLHPLRLARAQPLARLRSWRQPPAAASSMMRHASGRSRRSATSPCRLGRVRLRCRSTVRLYAWGVGSIRRTYMALWCSWSLVVRPASPTTLFI